jgi:hypothetical protein
MIVKTNFIIDDGGFNFNQLVEFKIINQVRLMKDQKKAKAFIKEKYLLDDFDTDTLYYCIMNSKDTSNL